MGKMEVTENKNAAENGAEEEPGEADPLNTTLKKPRYREPIRRFDEIGADAADSDDAGSQRSSFLSSCAHKCRLTPKKGLLYLIVCAIIIFILFIAVIIMASMWPSSYNQNVCQTAECHGLSASILGNLNRSVQPCEEFWEYSCGGWFRANPIPKSKAYWSTDKLEEYNVKGKIRTLINTQPARQELNSVDAKVKRFYQSCMALEYIEADKEKPLKKIIQTLGGWDVLRTFRQNEFDFRRVLKILQGEYRISPFFKIEVVSDPRIPRKSIIMISPAGLSLPDKSYYFKHKDPLAQNFHYYAKDVTQLLGATSDAALKFSEDIFEYEKRIARVTPDSGNLTDPIENFHKLQVSQLKAKSTTIFWDDLLKAIYPQGVVNDLTEVLVPSVQYLEDISSIISATDRPILNNYMMWHLTLKYSMYLSKPFTDAHEIYRKEATGSLEPTPRWEFCVDETIKFFPHAVNALLADNCEGRESSRLKIDELFDNIKTSLTKRVSETSRLDESLRTFALDKLRLMDIQIGTLIRNSTSLVDLYLSLDAQKDDFFMNVISATAFTLKMEQRDLASPQRDTQILWALAKNPFQLSFIPTANKIVVPESVLQRDVLRSEGVSQLPILYGSLGVELGKQFAEAFGPERGLYWSDGALMQEKDPKVQESRELIEVKRRCLASFFTQIRLDDEDYVEKTSLDTALHLAGIQIAFDTFKLLDFTYAPLPSLQDQSSAAVFFIAYGQSQCSASTLAFHDLEHSTFRSLSHDHRTRGVLRQYLAFTETMTCSTRSEMFADYSCGYVI